MTERSDVDNAPTDILGLSHPLLSAPVQVPFSTLQVDEDRFQIRNSQACSFSQASVKDAERRQLRDGLEALVKADITLDPFVVWRDADGVPWIVDGHHRHEALIAGGIRPDALVWVQEAKVSTEAEARALALDINKRLHLSLHPKELLENLWRATLLGEAEGSSRERVKRYQVSKGTVNNIDREAPKVLTELARRAAEQRVTFNAEYIREHAPLWRERKRFWKDFEKPKSEEIREMERQRILDAMLGAVGKDLKADPQLVAEAFEEAIREVSQKEARVVFEKGPSGRYPEFRV
ncbi:hypothetical protein L0Z16_18725 [Burkholderia multivorans]|uniref:hypothetical protein n=2 Tax=Burkholderia multivorans TaxID=87883 RepID=UPI000D011735|nr:hypothetical protein [Burkholderia multivorans]MBU9185810.1 hypothetical protein [Burkholderia multivorans]MCL4661261.1 hypothetical protein [Burkholderia multivorans]MCO1352692.1 hypothetical protein [Burkholderia multivorans]MCO1413462.1 hypothetical protein [Burkholderia multivorans]MCO1446349.1 hypothetical protein [Burkholderia multivorans]